MMTVKQGWTTVWILAMSGLMAAGPVHASRAALESRALPSGLAPDASVLFLYPALAGANGSQVLLDDDLVLALMGTGVRYGYLVDGSTHNLIVGGRSGWGVTLGFRDAYTSSDDERVYLVRNGGTTPLPVRSAQADQFENAERAFRLGLGWRVGEPNGRILEIATAGALIQGEGKSRFFRIDDDGDIDSAAVGFDADSGLGGEIGIRTLAADSGFLAAARFSYEDLRPKWTGPVSFDLVRKSLALDLGWRLHDERLDDLVIGLSLGWLDRTALTMSGGYGSTSIRAVQTTVYNGALFLSGEKAVATDLVVRAGVRAPATFSITEDRRSSTGTTLVEIARNRDTAGSLREPEISLGLGWKWRFLELDGRASQSIRLDSPLVRWAAKIAL